MSRDNSRDTCPVTVVCTLRWGAMYVPGTFALLVLWWLSNLGCSSFSGYPLLSLLMLLLCTVLCDDDRCLFVCTRTMHVCDILGVSLGLTRTLSCSQATIHFINYLLYIRFLFTVLDRCDLFVWCVINYRYIYCCLRDLVLIKSPSRPNDLLNSLARLLNCVEWYSHVIIVFIMTMLQLYLCTQLL